MGMNGLGVFARVRDVEMLVEGYRLWWKRRDLLLVGMLLGRLWCWEW